MSRQWSEDIDFSDRDLCWLAGLLEGEGCFRLAPRKAPDGRVRMLPSIQLGMTDLDVVLRAGKMLGGYQKTPRTRTKEADHHKLFYMWVVSGYRALMLMKLLLPLMGERRAAKIKYCIDNTTPSRLPHGSHSNGRGGFVMHSDGQGGLCPGGGKSI